jgi:hypothetical protein
VEVEPTLEPEVVLEAVVDREPVVAEVHELDTSLNDADLLLEHDSVDQVEDVRVDVVLGVEDCDDLAPGVLEGDIEAMGLVDRAVGEGLDPDPAAADLIGRRLRLGNRAGVVDVADDHDLEQLLRVVRRPHPFDGLPDDGLLVAGRQKDGEAALRGQEGLRRSARGHPLRVLPGVEHQVEREQRLRHENDGRDEERLGGPAVGDEGECHERCGQRSREERAAPDGTRPLSQRPSAGGRGGER